MKLESIRDDILTKASAEASDTEILGTYKAEITLGNPKAKCVRMGICMLETVTVFQTVILPENQVYAIVQMYAKVIKMSFLRSNMDSVTYEKHFSSTFFTIESAANFTLDSKKIHIDEGVYSCNIGKRYIEVIFPYTTLA